MWIGKGERAPAALSGPRPAIAAAGDEMEELFLYFTFVYDWVNVLQLIAVSFSAVLVLSSLSLTGRGLMRFGIQAACVFAAETLFNWLLFYLSHYLKWLAGINFPLAHLIVIAVYAAFVSRYNIKSRFVLSATVFVTAIVMAELGTQCMRLFASGGGVMRIFAAGADVLIVGFAVLINLRSIHIYDNIPKTSVASIITVAAASTALVLVAEVDSVANNMTADGNLCLMLLYIYLVTVAAYIITYHHCTDHNAKLVLEVDKKLMEADIKMLSLSEQVAEEMKASHGADFEFIFVDDGSKDKTLSIARELHKQDARVRYISFSRNFGKEAGILAGLKAAKGDYVAMMDADLQDPPALLPQMLDALLQEDYDCAATRRTNRKGEPPIRSFFARMFYKIINRLSDADIVDGARDYRLMRRRMVDAILALPEYNRFSKGIFGWVGFKTKWLEYVNVERVAGETKWSFWKLFLYSLEGIVAFTTAPLALASLIGIIFCVLAFVMILFIIVRTLLFGDPTSGWPSLVCIIFLCSGVQLFCMGVLGQYLAKTYMEVKHRPVYIVRETEQDEAE